MCVCVAELWKLPQLWVVDLIFLLCVSRGIIREISTSSRVPPKAAADRAHEPSRCWGRRTGGGVSPRTASFWAHFRCLESDHSSSISPLLSSQFQSAAAATKRQRSGASRRRNAPVATCKAPSPQRIRGFPHLHNQDTFILSFFGLFHLLQRNWLLYF